MDTGVPSPAEERLAAAYTALLRRVSACAQAVENGHWGYLETKAGELAGAAADLEGVAALAKEAGHPVALRTVLADVAARAGNDRAVRALHPSS
ncbi:hypothetical protein [Streptomyces sp. NPDC088775]|uniref:hypothetical protein n=1 Tax=Streptomyces sp. NPDC088775 TaxID=3365896 RepID=UPI00382F86CF